MFEAASRRDEARAKLELKEDRLNRTSLRAPTAGVIVTPRIEERVGQLLTRGSELCVIADSGSVVAEVAVSESDAFLVRPGQRVALKLNLYPTRIFREPSRVPIPRSAGRKASSSPRCRSRTPRVSEDRHAGRRISTERVPDRAALLRDSAGGPGTRSADSP